MYTRNALGRPKQRIPCYYYIDKIGKVSNNTDTYRPCRYGPLGSLPCRHNEQIGMRRRTFKKKVCPKDKEHYRKMYRDKAIEAARLKPEIEERERQRVFGSSIWDEPGASEANLNMSNDAVYQSTQRSSPRTPSPAKSRNSVSQRISDMVTPKYTGVYNLGMATMDDLANRS